MKIIDLIVCAIVLIDFLTVIQSNPVVDKLALYQFSKSGTKNLSQFPANSTIQITFTFINQTLPSPTFLIISQQPFKQDINISYFYSKTPQNTNNSGLDAMWDFRNQSINYKRKENVDVLYLKVINFDNFRRYNMRHYEIFFVVGMEVGVRCQACQNGGKLDQKSCVCQCVDGYSGALCTRKIQNIQPDDMQIKLEPLGAVYYRLPPNILYFYITINTGIAQLYIQYQTFSDEIASFYNVAQSQNKDMRHQLYLHNQQMIYKAQSLDKPILLTIHNVGSQPIEIQLKMSKYLLQQILPFIIVGVCLFVVLILVIAICIYNIRIRRIRIDTENIFMGNELSQKQIQRYFPVCGLNVLEKVGMQVSIYPLEGGEDRQIVCPICIDKIQSSDLIIIGYCKHIFHEICLTGWFKKNKSCPYCRYQFSKSKTLAAYHELCQRANKDKLKGEQLVIQIYNNMHVDTLKNILE